MTPLDLADLVIRDADVVDDSGTPSYRADVAVKDGIIVSIVKEAAAAGCQRPRAVRELDAEGLVLSPVSPQECVDRPTGRPAARLRLPDRGLVREGHRADLALFDPATVTADAGFVPTDALHVLIDGRFVIEDGQRTDVPAKRAAPGTGPQGVGKATRSA